MSPFSTSTTLTKLSHASHVTKPNPPSPTTSTTVCLAEFDWLGTDDEKGKGKGKGPLKYKKGQKGTDRVSPSSSSGTFASELENESRLLATKNNESVLFQSETCSSKNGSEDDDTGSYLTDEELGKTRKQERELDDEESDGDLVHVNWYGKKRASTGKRRRISRTADDGDENVYKDRIR